MQSTLNLSRQMHSSGTGASAATQPKARPRPQAPPAVRDRGGGRDKAGLRAGCDFVQMASDF